MNNDSPPRRCLIFLVDCSQSTNRPVAEQSGATWHQIIQSAILNSGLAPLLETDKARIDVAVVPYHTDRFGEPRIGVAAGSSPLILREQPGPLPEEFSPADPENGFQLPVGGGSPMYAALRYCHDLLSDWTTRNPSSPPPIVLHITDGQPTDRESRDAPDLPSLQTSQGPVLWMTCVCHPDAPEQLSFANDAPASHVDSFGLPLLHSVSSSLAGFRDKAWNPANPIRRTGLFKGFTKDGYAVVFCQTEEKLNEFIQLGLGLLN